MFTIEKIARNLPKEMLDFYMVEDRMWGVFKMVGCDSKGVVLPIMTFSKN